MVVNRQKQKGIVLVVSLLSLLVVSIVVTATLVTSGNESQMALNSQSQNQTFQAAETGVDFMMANDNLIYTARDASTATSSVQVLDLDTDLERLNAEAFSRYMGEGEPIGYSKGKAKSLKFEVEARGFVDDNGTYGDADDEARTGLTQGMYRIIFTDG